MFESLNDYLTELYQFSLGALALSALNTILLFVILFTRKGRE